MFTVFPPLRESDDPRSTFFFYIFSPPQLIAPLVSLVIGFPALCSHTLQWSRFELEG